MSLQGILNETEKDPCAAFDLWPLAEIRLAAIKAWRRKSGQIYGLEIAWVHDHLRQLIHNGETELFELLWSSYVDRSCLNSPDEMVGAITVGKSMLDQHPSSLPTISKSIFNALRRLETFHSSVTLQKFSQGTPLLYQIIIRCLERLVADDVYTETQWATAERAIDIILLAGDVSYLDRLWDIAERFTGGTIKPAEAPRPNLGMKHSILMVGMAKQLQQIKFPQGRLAL